MKHTERSTKRSNDATTSSKRLELLGTVARSNMADAHARDSLSARSLARAIRDHGKMINYRRDTSIDASPTIARDFRSALAMRGSLRRGKREKYDAIEPRVRTKRVATRRSMQNHGRACVFRPARYLYVLPTLPTRYRCMSSVPTYDSYCTKYELDIVKKYVARQALFL